MSARPPANDGRGAGDARTGPARRGGGGPGLAWVWMFFVSGAVAVGYEVLWQRQFALVFGSAGPAVAALLAAYFVGLGIGSLILGSLVHRMRRPLLCYALLELGIAAGALLVRPLLALLEQVYPWLFVRLSGSDGLFFAVRTTLALGTLAVPTCCLGGTLPVLARGLATIPGAVGRRIGLGRLYTANVLGAALGAVSVPYLLLPRLGLDGTIWSCAALNLGIAFLAWRWDRRVPGLPPRSEVPEPGPAAAAAISSPRRLRLLLAFVSGLVTFALQVQWNRAFAQVHENSVHAFALISSVFILALAAGARLARAGWRRGQGPLRWAGLLWASGGAVMMWVPWAFVELTGGMALLEASRGWGQQAFQLGGTAMVLLFVPVGLLGAGFPALLEGETGEGGDSRRVGALLAANTMGCVAGALIAGFLLPAWVGLWRGVVLVSALGMAVGVALRENSDSRGADGSGARGKERGGRRVAWVFAVLALAVPAWVMAGRLPRVRVASGQGERLLGIEEGTHGVVAVLERPGSRRLKLNNHYALGGTASVGDERMQSHLPLLMHPVPRRVGVLGLGTGISAGGALYHPVERLEVVELVPEVVTASRIHFADSVGGLHQDGRVRVIAEDARNYLRASSGGYDVLLGDLVVPWRQGEGALFTLEHFRAARRALAPGGMFCQWLPLFQLSESETRILLRTFLAVFPRAQVWRGDFSADRPALALVGAVGDDAFAPDPVTIRRRLGELRPDPTNPQLVDPAGVWMNHVGLLLPEDLGTGDGDDRINSEDRPWIELTGPLRHAGRKGAGYFVGRPLQRWLLEVRERSRDRLPGTGAAEREAWRAGDLLFEFSLLLWEGRAGEAAKVREQLARVLPPAVYSAVFGGP